MNKHSRSSRIKNWSLGDCVFIPENQSDEFIPPEIPLANLSETGLGLWIEDSRVYLPPGMIIKGRIKSVDMIFNAEARVIRQNNYVVGCNFTSPVDGLTEYLNSHYGVEKTAANMVSIQSSLLSPRPEGTPHWHSDGFSELYYIDNNEMLVYYRIHYQNYQIERIFDPSSHFKDLQKKSNLGKNEVTEVIRFLNHINELPFQIRKQILDDIDEM